MIDGITFSNGDGLIDLDNQCTGAKKLGYQMIHQDTGRILPMTRRNEIYSAWAATEKMGQVSMDIPTLDIFEYVMKPVYDFEVDRSDCRFIYSLEDDYNNSKN